MVLHHYPGSPFAEKIRRVLGHKELLRRIDERAGTLHVHFPRIGYVMRAVRAA